MLGLVPQNRTWQNSTDWLIELKVYAPFDTKYVIAKTFPKPISRPGMEKQNLTQQKHAFTNQNKCTIAQNKHKLECEPMPNVMVALPNIGGALCSTPQSLADAHY